MAEPTNTKKIRSTHSRSGFVSGDTYLTYYRPAIIITAALMLPVLSIIVHSDKKVAIFGALALIILTISKIRKFQFGIFFSLFSLLLMVMINLWHWADTFFIEIYSGQITVSKPLFVAGAAEGFITLAVVWFFHGLLKNLNMHVSQEWYVKKSQLKFLRLLTFFEIFLLLFYIFAFLAHSIEGESHNISHEAALISCCLAILIAGIPTMIYLFSKKESSSKRHHHRHHSRHASGN